MVEPVDEYLASEGLRHSSPALKLRLAMLFVGVAAAFLSMTYGDDEELPEDKDVIDELATMLEACNPAGPRSRTSGTNAASGPRAIQTPTSPARGVCGCQSLAGSGLASLSTSGVAPTLSDPAPALVTSTSAPPSST